jgi:DNA-binding MarR family transcriptional regulator
MPRALPPNELGAQLAAVFQDLGPLYRRVARIVVANEPIEQTSIGVRAVLEHLATHGPRTVPTIADALELSRQFVQRSVNDALDAGLIETTANPRHRRSPHLALTSAGHDRIARITARERSVLATTPGGLTAADIAACRKVLTNVMAALVAAGPRMSAEGLDRRDGG